MRNSQTLYNLNINIYVPFRTVLNFRIATQTGFVSVTQHQPSWHELSVCLSESGTRSRSQRSDTPTHLVVALLGEETAFPQDQVEGSTGHQHAVAHVTKHDGKQEGEGDDGVHRWDKRE